MAVVRAEVIDAIRDAEREAERAVGAVPGSAWDEQIYDDGWSAKQILAHVTFTSRLWSTLIRMAEQHRASGSIDAGALLAEEQAADRMKSGARPDATRNVAALIAQEMSALQQTPVGELVEELRGHGERAIQEVADTPDDLLAYQFKTPWGTEGTLAELIAQSSIREHVLPHLRDLVAARG